MVRGASAYGTRARSLIAAVGHGSCNVLISLQAVHYPSVCQGGGGGGVGVGVGCGLAGGIVGWVGSGGIVGCVLAVALSTPAPLTVTLSTVTFSTVTLSTAALWT